MLNDLCNSLLWSYQKWGDIATLNLTLTSRVPEEMRHKVPSHWQQFDAPHPLWQPILGTLYIMIGSLSVTGNSMVLWIFGTTRSLRSGTNLLVMNLALADLCMMLTQFPVLVTNCYNQRWTLGALACECPEIGPIIRGYTFETRRQNVSVPTVMSFYFSFLFSCTFDYLNDDLWSRSYVFVLFVGAYLLPLAIITICYGRIFSSVSRHDQKVARENDLGDLSSVNFHRRETQLARVVIISVWFWAMAWTPYAVISLMGILSWRENLTPLASMLPALFAKLSTVYNPFIYAVSHPRYRQELAVRLPWLCCRLPIERSYSMSRQRSLTSTVSRTSSVNNYRSVREVCRSNGQRSFRNSSKADVMKDLPSLDALISSMGNEASKRTNNTDL
ncbi:rhodopsin-like [Penaeus chinensis]|uniref:rhodopsin-like n=1 Tax=Penaeus chinensis TaxID=139456 RepID=UPI001FB76362|nr:rhodopsin-like [Penaeus chinensis]